MKTKFDEMIEEERKNAKLLTKIRLKILEYRYKILKDKTLLDAAEAAFGSEIYNENKEYIDDKLDRKRLETSKLFMYLIVINCTIIEAYSMFVMIHFADLSSLSALMCAVIAESVSFAVYCAKAYFGKKGEVDAELKREDMDFEREKLLMSTLPEDNSPEEFFDEPNDGSVG